MTTDQNSSQSRLSTDLETLHARVKDRALTLAELKQALKGRGSAMLLILLALPFCFVAIPGLSMPFGIAIGLIGTSLAIGREPWLPRFIMHRHLSTARSAQLLTGAISATLCFPARRAWYVAVDRLGDSYCQSRIDVAIAHSVLQQHSGLGGSASGHRNDGERRVVCVAWPFNCNGHLGLYWSDLRVRRWRFPEAL